MSDEEDRWRRTEIIVVAIVAAVAIGVVALSRLRGPAGCNRRGEAELKNLKLAEAERDFQEAVRRKPDFAEAWNNLSITYSFEHRLDEALRCSNRAIELKPDYADLYRNRANIYETLQRYDEAMRSYDQAIALKPTLAAAYGGRAFVFYELKRYSQAKQDVDICMRLGGSLPPDFLKKLNEAGGQNK